MSLGTQRAKARGAASAQGRLRAAGGCAVERVQHGVVPSGGMGDVASRAAAQRGFTLLEMLVALAIFSLAALALVRLQAVSARTTVELRVRTMAQIVARNLMIERLTDPQPPALGASEGTVENAGRQWPWAQQVEGADDGRLLVVTIRVDGGAGQSPAVLTFGQPAR